MAQNKKYLEGRKHKSLMMEACAQEQILTSASIFEKKMVTNKHAIFSLKMIPKYQDQVC